MQTPPSASQGRYVPPPASTPTSNGRTVQHLPFETAVNQNSDAYSLPLPNIFNLVLFFEQQGTQSDIKELHDCLLSAVVTWIYQEKAIQEESRSNPQNRLLIQSQRTQITLGMMISRLVSILKLNPNYSNLLRVCRIVTQETRNLFFDFISVQQLVKFSFIFTSNSELIPNLLLELLPDCAVDGQYWVSFFIKSLRVQSDVRNINLPGFYNTFLVSAQHNVVPLEEDEPIVTSTSRRALSNSDAQHSKRRKVDNARLQELVTMASKT